MRNLKLVVLALALSACGKLKHSGTVEVAVNVGGMDEYFADYCAAINPGQNQYVIDQCVAIERAAFMKFLSKQYRPGGVGSAASAN